MAARRKADALIAAGEVHVNGRPATAGQQVTAGVDEVTIGGRPIQLAASPTYLMLNKPVGVLTSVGDPQGRPTVADRFAGSPRLFPVGRLDLDSRGLLLLTNDGDLAMRLMHPRYEVEKEYHVVIEGSPGIAALRRLAEGMSIGGEHFQPARVRVLRSGQATTSVSMVLREGRKREVRRLWRALGHRVVDLKRVRIDGLTLGTLGEGESRLLTSAEIARLKAAVS